MVQDKSIFYCVGWFVTAVAAVVVAAEMVVAAAVVVVRKKGLKVSKLKKLF